MYTENQETITQSNITTIRFYDVNSIILNDFQSFSSISIERIPTKMALIIDAIKWQSVCF